MAIAPSGRIHVVFGKGGVVYHASSRDGRSFFTPVSIGSLEKLALGMRRGPRIAATDNLLLVTAISHVDGQIHSWLSADQGASWQPGADLNTVPKSAREGLQALTGDGRGLVAAAWLDLRNGPTELWSRVSRDGGRSWQPEVRIYAAPSGPICQCCHPSLAIGPSGAIAAMWRNAIAGSRDLWMAVSTDGGRTFPNPHKIGAGTWELKACPMDGGSLAFNTTGQPLAVWRREATIFLGATADAERKLADQAKQPVIAASRGGAWVAWEENGALKMQHNDEPTTVLSTHGRSPALAALPDGRTLAMWENSERRGPALFAEVLP